MIFKLVYEQEKHEMDWPHSTILSSSRSSFPYAIAAVCSHWRDAMSLIPEIWTKLVIYVDSRPAIPPSAILSQLSWSRDLPLVVWIVKKNFIYPVDNQHERAQVLSIMKTLINPHIDRIRSLYFEVMFSSSLPPFPDGFHGTATILNTLHLGCEEDNGRSADDWESVTSTEQQFPALNDLHIDGRNYFNMCKTDKPLPVKNYTGVGVSLSISHYKPPPGETFLASDFLRPIAVIEEFEYLNMIDLILDPSPLPLPTLTVRPYAMELRLEDIHNSQSLAEIFHLLPENSTVTLFHSAIGDVGPFNSEGHLILKNIHADEDLVPLLRFWEGCSLTVNHCPSFNDTVLHMMAPREDNIRNCAYDMVDLTIMDCPNFSVAALKQFVSAKSSVADRPGIQSLQVFSDVPAISDEDCRWLSENVDNFEQ
jgi:hypothetical protein